MALSGVVHAQIVSDLSHHDLAGVEPDARGEVQPVLALDLARVLHQALAELERGVAGALGVVFVGEGRPEQGHDAVARVLVDRPFEAMHAVRQHLEETIQDAVPGLRVHLSGQLHRALHVRKEHGDLLALSLQGTAAGEDPLGQVLRGVGGGGALGLLFDGSWAHRRCTGRRRAAADPDQDPALFVRGHALDLDELLLEVLEGLVVQIELTAQHAVRDATVLLQEPAHLADHLEKVHVAPGEWTVPRGSSCAHPTSGSSSREGGNHRVRAGEA
jgi:hypothetical protein